MILVGQLVHNNNIVGLKMRLVGSVIVIKPPLQPIAPCNGKEVKHPVLQVFFCFLHDVVLFLGP